jgi:hypothetical protein
MRSNTQEMLRLFLRPEAQFTRKALVNFVSFFRSRSQITPVHIYFKILKSYLLFMWQAVRLKTSIFCLMTSVV